MTAKTIRKVVKIDEDKCNGCGACIISCAEGALKIIDGKAKLISEKYCDGLGNCLDCPKGALTVEEREAEEFDEAAVEEMLSEKHAQGKDEEENLPCGCPSTRIQDLTPGQTPCQKANALAALSAAGPSALGHWPIKIRLVPPNAKFLENADLLVLADCSAVAYAGLHQDLLKDRVVMAGCPKFDEVEAYIQKFTEIFKSGRVKSITTVFMEVPCCSGLPMIVRKALAASGQNIPSREITIGLRGDVLLDSAIGRPASPGSLGVKAA